MRRVIAVVTIVGALVLGSATVVSANPGPGESHACAPGQQGNQDPAFKPAACDK